MCAGHADGAPHEPMRLYEGRRCAWMWVVGLLQCLWGAPQMTLESAFVQYGFRQPSFRLLDVGGTNCETERTRPYSLHSSS